MLAAHSMAPLAFAHPFYIMAWPSDVRPRQYRITTKMRRFLEEKQDFAMQRTFQPCFLEGAGIEVICDGEPHRY